MTSCSPCSCHGCVNVVCNVAHKVEILRERAKGLHRIIIETPLTTINVFTFRFYSDFKLIDILAVCRPRNPKNRLLSDVNYVCSSYPNLFVFMFSTFRCVSSLQQIETFFSGISIVSSSEEMCPLQLYIVSGITLFKV